MTTLDWIAVLGLLLFTWAFVTDRYFSSGDWDVPAICIAFAALIVGSRLVA